jgi:type IV pilus assembly protein PilM
MLKFARKIRKPRSIIGLALGNTTAYLLEAMALNEELQLLTVNSTHYVETLFQDGILINPKILTSILKPILALCTTRQVALHLANEFIFRQTFSLPTNLNAEDLEAYIMLEAEPQLAYPIEAAFFDFLVLGINNSDPDLNDILFVACEKSMLTSRITILQNLGFNITLVGIEHYLRENLNEYCTTKNLAYNDIFVNHSCYEKQLQQQNEELIIATALVLSGLKK